MNYYISEQNGSEQNAITKARDDVQCILNELGWKEKNIHRKIEGQKKLVHYLRMGFWTIWDWKKIMKNIEDHSTILLQFPMMNSLFYNKKAAEIILKGKKDKQLHIILLVHDIDSIRFPDQTEKQRIHEEKFWKIADIIIAHNHKMKQYLKDLKITTPIVELGIFDYLTGEEIKIRKSQMDQIIIAGNLDDSKAQYLKNLGKIQSIYFNLYGPNFKKDNACENVVFKGVYASEELPSKIEGAWGLVWDGNSIYTCEGGYGEYLRYNNPHKLSFYMSMGIPVIIWKEAALAEFVQRNKVGILVKSLTDIPKQLKSLTPREYKNILENTKAISEKVRKGHYLKEAIKKCQGILN